MESNEISMFMDVKLDVNEKKPETKFKSWTKCLVKIEAIKCLPCFLRITFVRNVEDESSNLSVCINIPGITISWATSRTKQFSYGIFWIQNRKRCFIYFAMDSEEACKRHMKWMKKSIKNMELHRQIFLETRRSSRGRLEGSSFLLKQQLKNEAKENKNPQDILGPLPKIPDTDNMNWSRRVSGFSGIYEEIPDPESSMVRRVSRASVASGIYEEMRPPVQLKAMRDEGLEPAPPLPPRKRVNTFEPELFIPRSNTNPESDLIKKKKSKSVLGNIFGRSKRSESVSEGKVSVVEDLLACSTPDTDGEGFSLIYANSQRLKQKSKRVADLERLQNKRNSFSSPDLSKINVFDQFEALDDLSSLSSELQICSISGSADDVIGAGKSSNFVVADMLKDDDLNISEQIQPNFNFSCNSSTINLVGANLNNQSTARILIDDLSGYCAMAPIKKPNSKQAANANDSDKENDETEGVKAAKKDKIEKEKIAEKPKDESLIYEEMTEKRVIYENLNEFGKPNMFLLGDRSLMDKEHKPEKDQDEEEDYYKTPRKLVTSIDDKIPSYYPNSCDTLKTRRRSPPQAKTPSPKNSPAARHLASLKVSKRENLYISSPQKIIDQRRKLVPVNKDKRSSPLMARKISDNVYTVMRLEEENKTAANDAPKIIEISIESNPSTQSLVTLPNIDFKFDDTKNVRAAANSTNRLYQKYATITRISPNKYVDKCLKKSTGTVSSNELSTVRKFASLPRFKKIDFSPLKLKINNVLQRHHNEEV